MEFFKIKQGQFFLNTFSTENLRNGIPYELWSLYEIEAWFFYIRLTYSFFSIQLGISRKSRKYSPNFTHTEVCLGHTAQKLKFSIKDFLSKCGQIRRKLRICSHLLKKSLMKNLIFWAVSLMLFINEFSILILLE